jgi:hypothetical protein
MPVRQDVQGGISTPTPAGYQSPGAARAQFQGADLSGLQQDANRQSAFWASLAQRGVAAGQAMEEKEQAKAYLEGQQDSEMGRVRTEVHGFTQGDYEQGYNRAQVGTDLAKFQLGVQEDAVNFVNSGKTPEDFKKHVDEKTNALLDTAGSQGMNLKNADWQAWLTGVSSTRDTAADVFNAKSLERATYMKQQAVAAEGNAAIATFMAADEAGNPIQALGNITSHIARVYSDDTLSVQQKDGAYADFAAQVMTAAKSSGAVEAVTSYFQASPEYKSLPTQVQTQIMRGAQSSYDQRAADEAGAVYEYISTVRAVQNPVELDAQYPMSSYIATLNEAQVQRKISPAQMYSMVEAENTRRLTLRKAVGKQQALVHGVTLSDISTQTGDTLGKTKTALVQTYAAQFGGYAGGGEALVRRGLQSGAQDITAVGIEMLQQDAQSLANIDSRQLKIDSEGNAQYPATVVSSLTNLKRAYDAAQAAGNNAQAAQLISGLPDAVGYGIRQASDANNVAEVVYRRADDIAAGRVVSLPAKMPVEFLTNNADLSAGLFDTSLTQKGAARNILGVQSYIFTSKEDAKMQESRLNQVNSAISEEYTSLYQQGRLPAYAGDDMKNWLVGRITARTVRVDDGTDAGTLMILPSVANKATTFGSEDNNILGESFKPFVDEFRARNPGAVTVQMRYDPMSNEVVFSGTDKDNILLTTSESVPASRIRDNSRAVEVRHTNAGNGNTLGSLAVPGVGFMKFNAGNKFGVDQQVYAQAVTQLVSYEGYTDTKGFSVLATHPTTGAPLNEEKYVKQPGDSPQVATNKFSMYLTDKVVPKVMDEMPKFSGMPEYLRQQVFSQLVDTTYHSGNAESFGDILKQAYDGDALGAYKAFRESALYKDAGQGSRRNQDRLRTLDAVSQFSRTQRNGY